MLAFLANQMIAYNYFICVPHIIANAILKCKLDLCAYCQCQVGHKGIVHTCSQVIHYITYISSTSISGDVIVVVGNFKGHCADANQSL